MSILCRFPYEILQDVAFELQADHPLGPPSDVLPLMYTCKHTYSVLSLERTQDHHLWARIHKSKFDIGAPRRRIGEKALWNKHLAFQLRKYCINLQRLRTRDIYHPDMLDILLTSFIMLTENDGKNRCHLDRAGLEDFVDRFVRARIYETRWEHNGWPAENAVNALALWLVWMTSSSEKLLSESEQRRQQMVNIVLPYVLLPCRYPATHAPPAHFKIPLCDVFSRQYPHSMITAHGPYPLYRDPSDVSQDIDHNGVSLHFSRPLITVAAKLIYFSRREIIPFAVPDHLPISRAFAIDVGPTQEDIIEVNAHSDTKLLPPTKWNWWEDLTEEELEVEDSGVMSADVKSASSKWDNDWMRLAYCSNPWVQPVGKGTVYTFGALAGLWQGRMLFPNEIGYISLISTPDYPPSFSEHSPHVSTVPVYMRLREHHCISPQSPVDIGGTGNGLNDGFETAYFPPMNYHRDENAVTFHANGEMSRYETYVAGRPSSHSKDTCLFCLDNSGSPSDYDADFASVGIDTAEDDDDDDEYEESACSGISDIVFTGETDWRHGQAWNHFTYIGRVRTWDGLIAILRLPHDRRLGKVIFYGYLVGGQNFVGNWRLASVEAGVPSWESAFSMSRRDD